MKRKKMKKTLKKIPPELTGKMIIDYDLDCALHRIAKQLESQVMGKPAPEYRRLKETDLDAVLILFADCMYSDPWYSDTYSSKEEMVADFTECMGWLLREGDGIGAWHHGSLVGISLSFPLSSLDSHMWFEWFGEGGLRKIMEEHADCNYIFALCVDSKFRGMGIGSRLLDILLADKDACVADTTGDQSFHIFERRGFSKIYSEDDKPWWRVVANVGQIVIGC